MRSRCETPPENSFRITTGGHRERNHQGLGNQIIEPGEELGQPRGAVCCRDRLGGMLRYYYRDAA
ncbi:MAG: hypothetical protein P1P84_25165 [Deferrisomatales bacterium]|nr:hypothetical protein [Deferrisomatales bacterium]